MGDYDHKYKYELPHKQFSSSNLEIKDNDSW